MLFHRFLTKFLLSRGITAKYILFINLIILITVYTALLFTFLKHFQKFDMIQIILILTSLILFTVNLFLVDRIIKRSES